MPKMRPFTPARCALLECANCGVAVREHVDHYTLCLDRCSAVWLLTQSCVNVLRHWQMIYTSPAKKPRDLSEHEKSEYVPGTIFTKTPKGSSSPETLDLLLAELIKRVDGEVANEDRKRILVKLDGGPGLAKADIAWLRKWRDAGVVLFPGLPNGSSVNQEMDQLYVCACCLCVLRVCLYVSKRGA